MSENEVGAGSTGPGLPLLITGDPELLDEVLRAVDSADVGLEVVREAGAARGAWSGAGLVLVGVDAVDDVTRRRLPRRCGVVLLGRDLDDASVWEAAGAVGAEHVAFLPDAHDWLVRRLGEAREVAPPVPVVCAVGGRGGAGASTLATALALTAVSRGLRCMLIDADPLGGGLDLMLGPDTAGGPRRPGEGDVGPGEPGLFETFPRVRSAAVLSLLSWDRDGALEIPAEAMRTALENGRRDCDLVVVDLPRRPDAAGRIALACGGPVLVVVPAEVRATAAAGRMVAALEAAVGCPDLRIVVRGPTPSGLSPVLVAAGLGLPLAGYVRTDRRLAGASERVDPPGVDRGPWAALCGRLLDELLAAKAAS